MPNTHEAPFSPGQPPAPLPPSHPTRTLILDAAEALFSEKGFDGIATLFIEVFQERFPGVLRVKAARGYSFLMVDGVAK